MSVFMDTSAFYAILDADDERHDAARAEWLRLIDTHFTEQGFQLLPDLQRAP